MAAIVVTRGLQVIGGRASSTADAFLAIQVMSVDDKATGFVAGDTTLGSPTTEFDAAFDATPTRSAQTISHVMTVPSSSSFDGATVKRIALHNDTAGNVTGSSTTLCAGVDGQTFAKATGFSLKFTLNITYT